MQVMLDEAREYQSKGQRQMQSTLAHRLAIPFMELLLCQTSKAFVYSDVEFLLRSHLYTFRE